MKKYYDVCVVFGGVSGENEISVITGTLACNVLIKSGKSVLPVYISHGGEFYAGENLADITSFKTDGYERCLRASFTRGGALLLNSRGKLKGTVKLGCLLNCCHGGFGEGGGIAGVAAAADIPFASAGLFESAAFMDKYYTKLVLKGLGADTVDYAYSRDITGAIAGAEALGYPVIVKPATLGSSIGIAKAENGEELLVALQVAFELDGAVIVERYIKGKREINCAAYYADGKVVVSPCEEVRSDSALLSYDDKYSGGGERVFPAELEQTLADKIREETARIYSALGMRGVVRFDYILEGDCPFVSEINTVPGSLSQYLLSENYSSFGKVLLSLIDQAHADAIKKRSKKIIKTGILNNVNSNACKLK